MSHFGKRTADLHTDPEAPGTSSPRLSGVSLSACRTASGRLSPQSPLGFQQATRFVGAASWGPRADRREHGTEAMPPLVRQPGSPSVPGARSPRGARACDSGDVEAGAFECPGSVRAAASRPALCVKGPRCGSGCLSPRLLGVQTPATSSSVSADRRSQLRSRDTKQTEVPLTLTSLGRRERVSFRAPRTALSAWEAQ